MIRMVAFITVAIACMVGGALCGLILGGLIGRKEMYWLGIGAGIGASIGFMVGIAAVIFVYMCCFGGRHRHNGGYHQSP